MRRSENIHLHVIVLVSLLSGGDLRDNAIIVVDRGCARGAGERCLLPAPAGVRPVTGQTSSILSPSRPPPSRACATQPCRDVVRRFAAAAREPRPREFGDRRRASLSPSGKALTSPWADGAGRHRAIGDIIFGIWIYACDEPAPEELVQLSNSVGTVWADVFPKWCSNRGVVFGGPC